MQNSKPVPCIKIGFLFENRSVLGCSSGLGSSGGMGQTVGSVLGMPDLAEVLLFVLHLHRSSGSLSRYLLDGFVSIEQGRDLLQRKRSVFTLGLDNEEVTEDGFDGEPLSYQQ
jgi:hypothetical protein